MSTTVSLSQAIEGYLIAAYARRLSRHTLALYVRSFRYLQEFLEEDRAMDEISAGDVRAFLGSLDGMSPNSVRKHYVGLSALWTWAVGEGVARRHVVREVDPPRETRRDIIPYTEEDVKAMLSKCERSRGYVRPGKRRCANSRPTAMRDRAMITLLVDTGIRASELCGLRIYQCDLRNQRVTVEGKGRKERVVPISARTAQVIWRYLATREDAERKAGFLFTTMRGGPMERNALRRLLHRIGERAGVQGVNVHRFRHTFAIWFLRNGGNVFALQRVLGHSTMTMVERYLAIAQTDVEDAHRQASPVANWLL